MILGMALDPSGRLAVTAVNECGDEPDDGLVRCTMLPVVVVSRNSRSRAECCNSRVSAFSGTGDLYVAAYNHEGPGEVLAYTPEPIGELTIGGSGCAPGVESDTSATFACTLKGEVNPEGVAGTEAFFEYGRTPNLGETTTPEKISATEPVHTVVSLRPNETYYYQLAGFDNNLMPPEEPFASEQASLTTETVAPHIGAPSVIAARPSSAVLFSELNPENASHRIPLRIRPERTGPRRLHDDRQGTRRLPRRAEHPRGKIVGVRRHRREGRNHRPATRHHLPLPPVRRKRKPHPPTANTSTRPAPKRPSRPNRHHYRARRPAPTAP